MTTPTTPPDPYGTGTPPPAGGGYPPPPGGYPPPPSPGGYPPAAPPPPSAWQPPPPAQAPPGYPPPGQTPPGYTPTPAPWPQNPSPADPNAGWNQPPVVSGGPPPAWGGTPAGGRTSFDPKSINPLDWGILGAGALAFIFSLFGFYTAKSTVNFGQVKRSTSQSASAWHEIFGGGFFGWFAMLLAVAGAVILALHLFVPNTKIPIPLTPRQLVLGLFAVGALFEILAIFVHPDFGSVKGDGFSASFGHGFSFWLSLILILAGAVLSFLRLKETGGKLPWENAS